MARCSGVLGGTGSDGEIWVLHELGEKNYPVPSDVESPSADRDDSGGLSLASRPSSSGDATSALGWIAHSHGGRKAATVLALGANSTVQRRTTARVGSAGEKENGGAGGVSRAGRGAMELGHDGIVAGPW
ncbi:hypothetical protein SASPL_119817 [Salvia splendens]|uniref:Uncharacterized protein n=1 Tax=Salvia splendens TaxID=180675 RepID=A0A8X8XTC8_SALSN|nr:hypothetical protein SASPL_119817 [Salvia splendens]